jgi:exodeoxyribonuclease V alpha subunit
MPEFESERTILEGRLERIAFHNPRNLYTVARFQPNHPPGAITVVGYIAGAHPGEHLTITGDWESHPRYGHQFRIFSCEQSLPATADGIREYLKSGAIPGIGPRTADRLVDHFGARTLSVLDTDSTGLETVEGIGAARAAAIRHVWQEHRTLGQLMHFLQAQGLNPALCAPIHARYGSDALRTLLENPYRPAMEIPQFGFREADLIARRYSLEIDGVERAAACIVYLLKQTVDRGHSYLEEDRIARRCENLAGIDSGDIRRALDELAVSGDVFLEAEASRNDNRLVYPRSIYRAEFGVADRIRAVLSVPSEKMDLGAVTISHAVHRRLALRLSDGQMDVLRKILAHRVAIITGGPGTGKTTLIRSIQAVFEANGRRVRLAAPTGRAARRLAELTRGRAETIHRLLEYHALEDRFFRRRDTPLEADVVIVDEVSMVDVLLMHHLLQALPATATLILVGDVFQLPSVGPGNVLSDLIASECLPVFYLKEIFRQARESPIIANAHRVRQGQLPILVEKETFDSKAAFHFVEQNDPRKAVETIVSLCSREIPARFGYHPVHDIQVLTPMHKGLIGTIHLNQVLQQVLNRRAVPLDLASGSFKEGDKVMHLKNNYCKEVFNGDIGIVREFSRGGRSLTVDYDGRPVDYDFSEAAELAVAYAISVHKSQGSEYPAVVVPIMTQHAALLQRNLLYTAITRAMHLVVLVGTRQALQRAVRNDRPLARRTRLAARLREFMPA